MGSERKPGLSWKRALHFSLRSFMRMVNYPPVHQFQATEGGEE